MALLVRLLALPLLGVIAPAMADPPGLIHAMDQAAATPHAKGKPPQPSVTTGAQPASGSSAPGVSRRIEYANDHAVDSQGHRLDAGGHPVGQAPATAGTSH